MIELNELSLAQRMFLLAYDPAHTRAAGRDKLGLVLNAAALQGLLDGGFLTDDDGTAAPAGARGAVPDDPLEAAVYARIGESGRRRPWRHWVRKAEHRAVGTVREGLAQRRVLRLTPKRILLVFPAHGIELRQPRLRTEAMAGVRDALRGTLAPSRVPRECAASAVFAHVGGMRTVLSWRERRETKARATGLALPLEPLPSALRRAIRDKQATQNSGG
ncbi:GPP34 family phosphoprotein [Yinghuangia sp. ASG 101]|uniref:GOLPH3/VPS74 family protein n=1 Tax=Yinghuangia sp. ASG 101 TaxID=2896848 RepID=UPI001E29949B|nr:GPP34 family phosphoprotein [Yinghuangia sp. ASG 101]UGQ14489.1 GPP34 family phosphoprotein [Yinghuangia sp. ASG 101]